MKNHPSRPKYTSEQVSRRRKVAAVGGAALALGTVIGVKQATRQPTEMVDVTVTFGQNGTLAGISQIIDEKYENNSMDYRDLVSKFQEARMADLEAQSKPHSPADATIVYPGESITVQIPQTDATEKAIESGYVDASHDNVGLITIKSALQP